jgi:hypothetical protein
MPKPLSADDRFAVIDVIQRHAHACDCGAFALFDGLLVWPFDAFCRSKLGWVDRIPELRSYAATPTS